MFTNNGFSNWKHAAGKNGILRSHAGYGSHVLAMQSWNQHKQNQRLAISIENHLDPTRCKQICSNRHYLNSVAETLLLTSHLQIAICGHDDS